MYECIGVWRVFSMLCMFIDVVGIGFVLFSDNYTEKCCRRTLSLSHSLVRHLIVCAVCLLFYVWLYMCVCVCVCTLHKIRMAHDQMNGNRRKTRGLSELKLEFEEIYEPSLECMPNERYNI